MTRAVVIGASGGIGAAIADALAEEGQAPIRLARSLPGEAHIDIEDEASIAAAAARVATGGVLDLVVVATGLLHQGDRTPEKSIGELDPAWIARQFAINAIGPAIVAKHFLPIMPRQGRCVFAVLSARIGSISDNKLGGWYGYRAAKAALNQFVRTLAIEERRRNDRAIVVGLHPGTVDTALSRPFQGRVREGTLFTPDRAAVQLLDVLDGLKAPDSGKLFDYQGLEIAP
ncbi:NAD(P)-dependent dehydrogenase (short-subunit alcohol dehydrogenase family) [Sphingomonas jinjuensis]|uniref:NAD(P)-dependent dehydrogenase (Short-subunit alcohol dehydrogenase family) n=1 Tax=Sphingomonas jinjuensis TaxID=535907 RepID=A0A840F4J9_9SPHN|nr:SDR family NAD(P)-dependent oxidoreductase [Sphingomonas jinjuensis]MBB4154233.1 NAD(P)-dependent dehydrogenase (short-subunit alcohol dehydrogenase family) [Sphingomonas jinjuensis]